MITAHYSIWKYGVGINEHFDGSIRKITNIVCQKGGSKCINRNGSR